MFKALFKRHININWAYHILLALDILWKLWLKGILEKANLRGKSVCTLINKVGKGRWRMGNSFMQSSTLKHLLVLISSIGLRLFKGFEEDVQDGALWPSLTLCLFFFYHGFLSRTLTNQKGRDHFLFHSTTSIRSRTFRHLFATLHVRWLSHIFNRNACIYSTRFTTLSNYCLINWWCDVDFRLFTRWFDFRFCYIYLTLETGGLEFVSTIIHCAASWGRIFVWSKHIFPRDI